MTKIWKAGIVVTLLAAGVQLTGKSFSVSAQAPPPGAAAQTGPAPVDTSASNKEETIPSDHTVRVGGQSINYKATAGTIQIENDAGEPTALIYYTSYTKSDVKDMSQRPIAFLYNGGPGSSSIWLHMGAFGPRKVVTKDGDYTPPAP